MKLKLEIRGMDSADVTPYAWSPDSRDDVFFALSLEIGSAGVPGTNIFQVLVVTPEGLRGHAGDKSIVSDRACIVLSDFLSWKDLRTQLQTIVDKCAEGNWADSVARLQRYFLWEYEDYR